MKSFRNIVIIHPGAIGDVMLATPVAMTLKASFPDAKVTYLSHASLQEILGCCQAIDQFLPYKKDDGWLGQRSRLKSLRPDLIVDLAGSNRLRWLTFLSAPVVLRYKKRPFAERPVVHAVDNFLATLDPIKEQCRRVEFPTLTLPDNEINSCRQLLSMPGSAELTPIGLVPGVGKLRPHRAWISEGWTYLARILKKSGRYLPVLIGGADEASLAEQINKDSGDVCLNLAGKLSLVSTACVLKLCKAMVSGDTGPAHIAVAVGTPVVGLYGPTFPERSGPYGCQQFVISQSHQCRCMESKFCTVTNDAGPGECMRRIMLEEVCAKLRLVLADANL